MKWLRFFLTVMVCVAASPAHALDWYVTAPTGGLWPLVPVTVDYYIADGPNCASPRIGVVTSTDVIPEGGAKVSTLPFENTRDGKTVTLCATAIAAGFFSSEEVSRTDTFPPGRLAKPVLSAPR